jgi:hypothetical protein
MTVDDNRERARELIEIGNKIQEKVELLRKTEDEIEKLQIYRNERGDQLLHNLMEKKYNAENCWPKE